MTSRTAPIAFVAVMWTASAALAQPQPAASGSLPPYIAQPIPLYKVGLGSFSRKISSSNADTQAYFD